MGRPVRHGPRFGSSAVSAGYSGGLMPSTRKTRNLGAAMKRMKERAQAGDPKAKARWARCVQSTYLSREDERAEYAQIRADQAANKAPPGHTRLTRRDPVTGNLNTVDIPLTKDKMDDLFKSPRVLGDRYGLEEWMIKFVTTGRYQGDSHDQGEGASS